MTYLPEGTKGIQVEKVECRDYGQHWEVALKIMFPQRERRVLMKFESGELWQLEVIL